MLDLLGTHCRKKWNNGVDEDKCREENFLFLGTDLVGKIKEGEQHKINRDLQETGFKPGPAAQGHEVGKKQKDRKARSDRWGAGGPPR